MVAPVQTTFANLAQESERDRLAAGGVDNYDPASNEGYFIGVDMRLLDAYDPSCPTPGGARPSPPTYR